MASPAESSYRFPVDRRRGPADNAPRGGGPAPWAARLAGTALCFAALGFSCSVAPAPAEARITVNASVRSKPISRYLFGKFTEHIWTNVYQGAWAQIVVNPEFAPGRLWPRRDALERVLKEAAAVFGQPNLLDDARRGLTPFWSVSGGVRGRWLEAGRRYVQELKILEGGGAIETGIFPPLHRTRRYEFTVKMRARQPTEMRVEILTAAREAVGEVTVPVSNVWAEIRRDLEVRPREHKKGDPYLLRLAFPAGASVEIDRVLLFPADHVHGWDPEVVAFMKNARLPMLRFPGGNFSSGYHWEDGVGPIDERPVLPNPAWPIIEWNHVGTDDWLRLCEIVGAEPLICINAGNGSTEEARRWVEYVNGPPNSPMGRRRAANGHPEPYGVRYWEIGNELYGRWQIGYTDGEGYALRYADFVAAMRKADPNLLFIANGLGGLRRTPDGKGYRRPEWNYALVRVNGAEVRSISVHPLIGGRTDPKSDPVEIWEELVAFADGYGDYLEELVGKPMREAGLEPKVAITEMQIFTHQPSLPNNKTIAEPLWLGSILHTCFRSRGLVELLTHSALLNHGGGLGKRRGIVYAEPVWWATHLYSTQPGTIPVEVRAESPVFSSKGRYCAKRENVPYLDAAALLDPEGKTCTVFVINRHAEKAMETTLELEGFPASEEVEAVVLKAGSLTERNSWDDPDRIRPQPSRLRLSDGRLTHRFPPLSLTRLTIRRR